MNTARIFASAGQQTSAFGLALLMTWAMLASVTGLADRYQEDARIAAQQATPASQQVVGSASAAARPERLAARFAPPASAGVGDVDVGVGQQAAQRVERGLGELDATAVRGPGEFQFHLTRRDPQGPHARLLGGLGRKAQAQAQGTHHPGHLIGRTAGLGRVAGHARRAGHAAVAAC